MIFAAVTLLSGHLDDAEEQAHRTLQAARSLGATRVEARALGMLGMIKTDRKEFRRG